MLERIRDKKGGFTLPELLIVVAIIAVLVAIAIPVFNSQLESSRRAVDMANARDIYAALKIGVNTGDIEFDGDTVTGSTNPTCVAVVVGPDGEKTFVSGSVKINGKTYSSGNGHTRIKEYLQESGCGDFTIESKSPGSDGWTFFAVFLYADGSTRIGSGTDTGYNDYRDDTFENHGSYWKNSADSNIEQAMGIAS